MRVFCDFDGTITTLDTTDQVLAELADPRWEDLQARWIAGQMTAAACMREQVALIGADDAALDALLDTIELTAGFEAFAAWCDEARIPLVVVSDGVDYFIRRILDRHGLRRLPVIANHLAGDAVVGRSLQQPWLRDGCAAGAGVCKCRAVSNETAAGPMVYVGDGRSDFCVSATADLLFAKGVLATYAQSRGAPYHPFTDFHDVRSRLEPLIADRPRRATAGPTHA